MRSKLTLNDRRTDKLSCRGRFALKEYFDILLLDKSISVWEYARYMYINMNVCTYIYVHYVWCLCVRAACMCVCVFVCLSFGMGQPLNSWAGLDILAQTIKKKLTLKKIQTEYLYQTIKFDERVYFFISWQPCDALWPMDGGIKDSVRGEARRRCLSRGRKRRWSGGIRTYTQNLMNVHVFPIFFFSNNDRQNVHWHYFYCIEKNASKFAGASVENARILRLWGARRDHE